MSVAILITGKQPTAPRRRRPAVANEVERQRHLDIARALYILRCSADRIARAYGCSRRSVYNYAAAALAYPEWAAIARAAKAS